MVEPCTERRSAKEDALPDLPLVIRDSQRVFTAAPQEWKREWGCKDTFAYHQELQSIRAPREIHFEDAGEWAKGLDVSGVNIRTVYLSFPFKTSIGLDQHSFQDIARLPDIAFVSLGEIVRQSFVKLAIQTQSLLQLLVL